MAVAVFACLFVTSCSTPYQEMGARGGVEATSITNDTVQIAVRLNAYTDKSLATQYLLLKSAETTIENGFGHFQVLDQDEYSKDISTTSGNQYYGNYQFNTVTMRKPRIDAIIKMFSGRKPEGTPSNVYDANDVVSTLGPKLRN